MAENIRGLVVPAPTDAPKRAAFDELADSINDFTTVANDTERDQMVADLTSAGLPTNGLVIFHEADKAYFSYVSGSWSRMYRPGAIPYAMASGTGSISTVAGVTKSTQITFPSGRFQARPYISVTAVVSLPNILALSTGDASATGFTLYAHRTNTNNSFYDWIAVQPEQIL